MALNGAALGLAIKNQLVADGNAINDAQSAACWDSIGKAIVTYLTNNTVVNAGAAVATPDTFTGTVTGTGTIT